MIALIDFLLLFHNKTVLFKDLLDVLVATYYRAQDTQAQLHMYIEKRIMTKL